MLGLGRGDRARKCTKLWVRARVRVSVNDEVIEIIFPYMYSNVNNQQNYAWMNLR